MKKVVITGATGAIGLALIQELQKQQIFVYAVCHPESKRAFRIPVNSITKIIYCSMHELDLLPCKILEQIDVFYHFAWKHAFGEDARNDMQSQIQNIQGTLLAVHAAKALGCHSFIGAGSQAEYGRTDSILNENTPCFPENGYGMAKLCAGQMSRLECEKLGLRHIWTRILSVYGPYDGENTLIMSMIQSLLRGEKPKCTKGEQKWNYIYSGDAANAFVLLEKHGRNGEVYLIGSQDAYPLLHYMEMVRDVVNPYITLGIGEIPYPAKQVMHLQADITKLRTDTGFTPTISFREGIKKILEWLSVADGKFIQPTKDTLKL